MEATVAQAPATEVLEDVLPFNVRDASGEEWVLFDGSAEMEDQRANLVPNEDGNALVVMPASDVKLFGKTVWIRVGSKALSITLPEGSPAYQAGPLEGGECRGFGTRCVGKTKFCCDNNENRGACPRGWTCPNG